MPNRSPFAAEPAIKMNGCRFFYIVLDIDCGMVQNVGDVINIVKYRDCGVVC